MLVFDARVHDMARDATQKLAGLVILLKTGCTTDSTVACKAQKRCRLLSIHCVVIVIFCIVRALRVWDSLDSCLDVHIQARAHA